MNGTFQSVTTEVGSLGLSGAVVGAIPNAVVTSEGLYGAPSDNYEPTSGGFWGTFWNAVSAVVTNPLGAVLSLVDTVWNAGTAAFTYLNHLAHEAVAIGAEIVARTAAAIVHVGQILAGVIAALLSYLDTIVRDLFVPVFNPVVQGMNQYGLRLASDIEQTYNDSSANKSIDQDTARFWSDASGGIFLFIEGVAVAVTVVLTILEDFSLGAGFLLPIIVGFVMGGAIGALADKGGPSLFSDFENLNPISPALASEWESIFDPPNYLETLSQILGIATTSWAATSIESAWENDKVPEWTDEAGFAIGVLGLIIAGVAAYYSSTAGAVASLLFDGSSAAIDVYSSIHEPGIENVVVAVIDGATVVIDADTFGLPI